MDGDVLTRMTERTRRTAETRSAGAVAAEGGRALAVEPQQADDGTTFMNPIEGFPHLASPCHTARFCWIRWILPFEFGLLLLSHLARMMEPCGDWAFYFRYCSRMVTLSIRWLAAWFGYEHRGWCIGRGRLIYNALML